MTISLMRYEYTEYEFATLREMSRAYVKIQDGCNNFVQL